MLHRPGWTLALSLIIALSLTLAGCDTVGSVGDRVAGMWRDSPAQAPEQADPADSGRAGGGEPDTDQPDDGPMDTAGSEGEARAAGSAGPAGDDAGRGTGDGPDGRTVLPNGRLFTVQVAAFVNADSAAAWSERLGGRGLPVWVTETTQGGRTYHRVRIGAVARLGEARGLGERIQNELRMPVWVAPVEPTTRIPADLVQRTLEHLGGA